VWAVIARIGELEGVPQLGERQGARFRVKTAELDLWPLGDNPE
jgi:hypothetical protein